MTREEAEGKAGALTAAGTPTLVRKDADAGRLAHRHGGGAQEGPRCVPRQRREYMRDARYNGSEKARAANARAKLGYNHGKTRLNEGTRFAEADLAGSRAAVSAEVLRLWAVAEGAAERPEDRSGRARSRHRARQVALLHLPLQRASGPHREAEDTDLRAAPSLLRVQAALWMPWLGMSEAEIRRARRRARAHVDAKEAMFDEELPVITKSLVTAGAVMALTEITPTIHRAPAMVCRSSSPRAPSLRW